MEQIILTGDRPTGRLHVGHYVGSLKRRVELQNSGKYDKIFIMIADAQALTDNAEHPEKVRQNIIEVALDYLACGLDPVKSTMFIQSQIPELCELSFYYMNLVTVARLQRNPTVKSKSRCATLKPASRSVSSPTRSARRPTSRPSRQRRARGRRSGPDAGADQEIVRKFNAVCGDTLVEPRCCSRTTRPACACRHRQQAKMSKSLGNCIYLGEDADEVKKKVMSMFTDPNHLRVEDPGQVEDNPVFIYLDAFSRPEHFERHFPDYQNIEEMKAHYTRGGLGDMKVKKFLNNVLQDELEPIRNRRRELEKDIPAIYDILKEGSMRAREAAARTLDDVRRAMKINYFEDMDLISEQAKKYARSCG
ncbi:MAG: tryptophan--tRNA ligase [Bilophila wadsworthia]